MPPRFRVTVLEYAELAELEGARTPKDFAALLQCMEYGDTSGMSDAESREMCVLSLQELEPDKAAEVVLTYDHGDALRKGQIQNMAPDMGGEKMWEHYADMARHEQLFNSAGLLYAAFPANFPEPDAVQVTLELTAANEEAQLILAQAPTDAFVARVLAAGMPEAAVLNRLFSEELAGTSFAEASSIIWRAVAEPITDRRRQLRVTSSAHWLDTLRDADAYEATAHPDDAQDRDGDH